MPGGLSRRPRAVATLAALLALSFLPTPAAPAASQESEERAAAIFAEADALLRIGELLQASDRLELLLREFPADRYPDLVWRAAARVRRGDLRWRTRSPEAATDYLAVIDSEPESPWTSRARLRLAEMVLANGDWVGAADLLQRVILDGEAGGAAADLGAVDDARQRLALLHRFRVRVPTGQLPWTVARAMTFGDARIDRPVAIAAAPDGQLLVVDEGIPAVLLLDAAHARTTRLGYNDHTRPWWGADGLPYLPTRRSGVIALGGSRLGFLANEQGRSVPLKDLQAGVRTPAGLWFLLDHDPRRVIAFESDGTYIGLASAARDEPQDVAVDADGRLHILDRQASAVVRLERDNSRTTVASARWRRPEAIDVDALGNVYVLDRDARTVSVYDPDGNPIQVLGPVLPGGLALDGPRDLSVDGEGRIYVVDRDIPAVVLIQ